MRSTYRFLSILLVLVLLWFCLPFATVVNAQAIPTITYISPDTASAGTNSQVTITGTNFGATQGESEVDFWRRSREYSQATIVSWTNTSIVCYVPKDASGSETIDLKLYGVRVTTPTGISNDFPFNVTFGTNGDKWFGSNPMSQKFVVNDTLANCPGALQAVIHAAQTWNSVGNANFYFEYGGRSTIPDSQGDGINEIIWKPLDSGTAFAYIRIPVGRPFEIVECDIYLNSNAVWSTDGSTENDVLSTVTHELGHWLFLGDLFGEQNRGKVMFAGSIERTLAPEDIEGIRYLYPGTGTRGQYHVKVTNNDDDPQTVYFKSEVDSSFTRSFEIPAGQTVNSWWEVVSAGNHQVSIQWTDPDKGIADTLTSTALNVPIEGDTEYSFVIPASGPPAENHPPLLSPIGNKTSTVGQALTFTVSAIDQDGDALTYAASNLPQGAAFNASTHTFSWTPAAAGTYSGIIFSVTDNKSAPVSETISITVNNPVAQLPTITSISPDTASAGTNSQVTITGANFGATQGSSKVEFWWKTTEYAQASIVSWTDTTIVCYVPYHASGSETLDSVLHGVRVTTPAGASNDFPFNVTFGTNGYKWPGSKPMGKRFFVNDTLANCAGALQAVINAAQTWNSVANANFYFEYGGRTTVSEGTGNGINEIIWKPLDYDTAFTYTAGVVGRPFEISECDIYINSNYPWSINGSTNYDVQSIATHEFGHWLFLSDLYGEKNQVKVMGKRQRILAPADIEGLRWLYPGTGTRGQYHVKVTNNDDDPQTVYFKSDVDNSFTRSFEVPAGQTVNSWWEVVPGGSHQVSIQWTDPDKGMADTLTSATLNIPIEGDTEYSFVIPANGPPAENHPPVLAPIGNKTGTVGQALTFTASATDQDSDTLTYSASNLPQGATFNASTHTFSWTPSAAGTYSGIVFSVTDNKSAPVSETINITVNAAPANQPPVLNLIGNKTGTIGQPISFTVSASDPENDPLTYSASNLPQGATFDATTHTFNCTPTTAGTFPGIHFEVSDGKASDAEDITITVSAPNTNHTPTSPVIGFSPNPPVTGSNLTCTIITPSTDPDGDNVTYTYQWYKGDILQSTLTTNTIPAANLVAGEVWKCIVTPSDGTLSGTPAQVQAAVTTPAPPPPPPPAGGGGFSGGGGATEESRITSLAGMVSESGKFIEEVTAESVDIQAKLVIPKDAVGKNKGGGNLYAITIKKDTEKPSSLEQGEIIGNVYSMQPDGATFEPSANLTMKYNPELVPEGYFEDDLVLACFNGEEWEILESKVDTEKMSVTAQVPHFSKFAVLSLPPAPAKFETSNLRITPDKVLPNGEILITVNVANNGGIEGTYKLILAINGTQEAQKDVTLGRGEETQVSFTVSKNEAGSYTITLNDLSGSFTVEAPLPPPTTPKEPEALEPTTTEPEPSQSLNEPEPQQTVQNTTTAAPEASPTTSPVTEPGNKASAFLWLGLGVVLTAIGVTVGIILRRRY